MNTDKPKKKVLLIGWDAADWDHINPLLEQGLLPHLEQLINEGVMGNLATLEPILSPMLWNSAATGKYAFKHGIHGFVEPDRHHGGSRPYSSYSRKCKALWNIFSQQGLKSNVINWWASHPAEPINGCIVSNLINGVKFGKDGPIVGKGTVHPEDKAEFYGQFKVLPNELESEQICAFIPKGAKIDQDSDSRIQQFANTLAETLTTHSVATAVMENEPWDFMAVYYTAIDHFSHTFMLYHPPKLPRISDEEFEIFKDVVTGAYRFSDMMLRRLLDLAGDDCYVILCSDHGFHSGALRPKGQPREPAGPAIWHRRYGIFVMKGPGIKKDERIYGASLINITPTILATMGMPIGEDMDGRPLLEVFEDPPEVETIPSWETVEGEFDSGMHKEEKPLDAEDAEDLLQQFIALGYVDDPGADKEKQYDNAEIECHYNVARSYMFANQSDQAIVIMEGLVRRAPWESRFINQLIQCYQKGGYLRQASNLIEAAYDVKTTTQIMMRVVWVELQIALGNDNDDELFELLDSVEHDSETNPTLLKRIGQTYAKLRRWRDAERVYLKAVEIEPENADAWQGLSRVYCRLGDNQKTIDCALEAVSLIHRLPHSHLNLGIALSRSGHPERAVTAFTTALQFSPGFVPAHRWLATIYRTSLGDEANANKHTRLAEKFAEKQKAGRGHQTDRTEQLFDLPQIPSEDERFAALMEERPDRTDPRKPSGKTFVLVSGLPRSGTSLMMQMLEAGGLPAKTDGERSADSDNPKGYYEWEAIKQVAKKPQVLLEEGLENYAIKCISMLLESMPYAHNYKTIFMTRPVEEVVASQSKMIERLKTDGSKQTVEDLAKDLANHRAYIKKKIESNPRNEILEIDYPTLVESPEDIIPLIAEFLGDKLPHPEKMIEVIEPSLYRQKKRQKT